ncbi:MAG: AMP-binding protein, partial [Actinomycetes bacterium]
MDVTTVDRSIDRAVAQPSLPAAFLTRAEASPDRVALRRFGSDEHLTLGAWASRASAVAGGLASLGVARGDRVALLLTIRMEFHIADMGALLAGAVPFSLYVTSPPNQLAEILDNAEPGVLITEAALLQTARLLRDQHPGLTHLVVVDPTELQDGELSLAAVEARCPPDFNARAGAAAAQREDICTLVY